MKAWTEDEIKHLKEWYNKVTNEELYKALEELYDQFKGTDD